MISRGQAYYYFVLVYCILLASAQAHLRGVKRPAAFEDASKKFAPLQCNTDLDQQVCIPFSQFFANAPELDSAVVVIPCGECVILDQRLFKTDFGIDIQGKLVIEDRSVVEIHTPFVRVQGELEITSTKPVNRQPDVTIYISGHENEESTRFEPAENNREACFGGLCEVGSKPFVVAGGKVTLNGLPEDTPSWLHLDRVVASYEGGEPDVLVMSGKVLNKWTPGAEVLITSHTTNWQDQYVRTVAYVEPHPRDSTLANVYLTHSIPRPATLQDNLVYASEVALLSRNILLQGIDKREHLHQEGAHMTIFHTPNVVQRIEGVEFRNFGHQGVRGRYPIHFEFCGDLSGSVVSKNTIRKSHQRCVVVHGTDNLKVDSNVAYDTAGHCYTVDGGMETGNTFSNNLGAMTRPVEHLMPQYGVSGKETDDTPSTFWMANPSNSWTGNIAAGSHSSAYWLELRDHARGPHWDEYSTMRPKEMPLTLFASNVAHSNGGYALKANGYTPAIKAVFRGFLSFLNQGKAIDFVENDRMAIVGGIFTDEDTKPAAPSHAPDANATYEDHYAQQEQAYGAGDFVSGQELQLGGDSDSDNTLLHGLSEASVFRMERLAP